MRNTKYKVWKRMQKINEKTKTKRRPSRKGRALYGANVRSEYEVGTSDEGRRWIRIVVSGTPLSTNAMNSGRNNNPWARKKNRDQWKYAMVNILFPLKKIRFVPMLRFRMSITRYAPVMMDYDGLVASLKPIVDGLKNIVIADDAWKNTGPWYVLQEKAPAEEARINILITE